MASNFQGFFDDIPDLPPPKSTPVRGFFDDLPDLDDSGAMALSSTPGEERAGGESVPLLEGSATDANDGMALDTARKIGKFFFEGIFDPEAAVGSPSKQATASPYRSAVASANAAAEKGLYGAAKLVVDLFNPHLGPLLRDADSLPAIKERVNVLNERIQSNLPPKSFESWESQSTFGEKADWIAQRLVAQYPSMVMSTASLMSPAVRAVTIPYMGAESGGAKYLDAADKGRNTAALEGVVNAAAEIGPELIGLGVFDKLASTVRQAAAAGAKDALLKRIANRTASILGVTAAGIGEEGSEEAWTQWLQNLADIHIGGEDKKPGAGIKEAFIVGGAMGGPGGAARGALDFGSTAQTPNETRSADTQPPHPPGGPPSGFTPTHTYNGVPVQADPDRPGLFRYAGGETEFLGADEVTPIQKDATDAAFGRMADQRQRIEAELAGETGTAPGLMGGLTRQGLLMPSPDIESIGNIPVQEDAKKPATLAPMPLHVMGTLRNRFVPPDQQTNTLPAPIPAVAAQQASRTLAGLTPEGTPKPAGADLGAAASETSARQAMSTPAQPAPAGKAEPAKSKVSGFDPSKYSVLEAVAKLGGLNLDSVKDDLDETLLFRVNQKTGKRSLPATLPGTSLLFARRKGGMTLDGMAEALSQHGYPVTDEAGRPDANKLLDLLNEEARGTKTYSNEVSAEVMLERYDAEMRQREDDYLAALKEEAEALDAQVTELFGQAAKLNPEGAKTVLFHSETDRELIGGLNDIIAQEHRGVEKSRGEDGGGRQMAERPAGEAFGLEALDEADLPARQKAVEREQERQADADREADARAAAERTARDFVLTRDNTEQAEAEARGQKAFDLSPPVTAVDEAAHQAATSPLNDQAEPTEKQKESGRYQKGHTSIGGFAVDIENPEGSKRRPEWPPLQAHYGYFPDIKGKDKDRLDVFVKPGTPEDYSGPLFVVDQVNPETGRFDEHKVMAGWDNAIQAAKAYRDNYSKDWKGLKSITRMTQDEFREWTESGRVTEEAAKWKREQRDQATAKSGEVSSSLAEPKSEQRTTAPVAESQAPVTSEPGERGEEPAAPKEASLQVGHLVKLQIPGLNGPINVAGTIRRFVSGDRAEVKTQNHGYYTVAKSKLTPANPREMYRAPVSTPKADGIDDVGEKVGGARKDLAEKTGPRGTREKSEVPGWRKRYEVSQIVKGGREGEEGRWVIRDARREDWKGQPRQVGRETFATREEAEAAVPLAAVSRNHRAVPVKDGKYEIWRDITDRKRVKVVDRQFDSRDDAMRYMAQNAEQIIETKTSFGEDILPIPDTVTREGPVRRAGNVTGEDFMNSFGLRAVEFGLWENQEERQQVMNHAYDAFADLAEVLNIPPRAIGLNGELALAFGARGHGLAGARAHYERDYGVINLTKMRGAGSLAHEWLHAADHYFGRQDTKAGSEKVRNERGDLVYPAKGREDDYVSHGFSRESGVREALRQAYQNVMDTLSTKAEKYVEDTQEADRFSAEARNDLANALNKLRADLASDMTKGQYGKYYEGKRNTKPATAEQLAEFDAVAEKLVAGEFLETDYRLNEPKQKFRRMVASGRWTNDALEKLSEIYKAVRGRSGFSATGGAVADLTGHMKRYSTRLKMLAEAQSGTEKTKKLPTSFVMEAKSIDQGRGEAYWATPHEMAARAFQAYVEDKIAEKGGKSDFLTYGTNLAVPTPWGWKRPFPHGEERRAINAAFDRLVGELKTKETDRGVAMFSRSRGNDTRLTALFNALTEQDGIFRYPVSDSKNLAQIAAQIDPAIRVIYSGEIDGSPGIYAWTVRMADGQTSVVQMNPKTQEIWINASSLREGESMGSALYAMVGNWAYNNGYRFIGDPEGVSNAAIYRRTENMISLALKFGTTDFLTPHPDQLVAMDGTRKGQPFYWPGFAWKHGDTVGNLDAMLRATYNAVVHHVPEVRHVIYDAETDQFRDTRDTGGLRPEIARSGFDVLARTEGARAAHAGATTLERAALANTVLSGEVSEAGWRGILDRLASRRGEPAGRLRETFMSRPEGRAGSRMKSSGVDHAQAQAIVQAIAAKWANAPKIVVARNMDDPAIPANIRSKAEEVAQSQKSGGAHGEPEGFYADGAVYLLTEAMVRRAVGKRTETEAEAVIRVLAHEALGHAGLRGFFGKDLERILRQIIVARNADVRRKAAEYGLDMDTENGRLDSAEEFLAELAQTRPTNGFVKRAIEAIREVLRRLIASLPVDLRGTAISRWANELTDAEIINDYLLPARRFIEGGTTTEENTGTTREPDVLGQAMASRADKYPKLRELFAKYDDSGEISTVDDLADEVDALIAEGLAPADLQDAVDEYRSERDENLREWGGRGDEDAYEGALVEAVKAALDPTKSDISFSRQQAPQLPLPGQPTTPPPQQPTLGLQGGAAGNSASWNAPADSWFDDIVYRLQDKHVDTKRVQEAIAQRIGQVRDYVNVRQAEELFHGRTAERVTAFMEDELTPLLDEMRDKGVSQEELGQYLWARHAEETNQYIAGINPKLQDGGSGMTTQEARTYLNGLPADKLAVYQSLAAKVDAITAGTRDLLVDYGILSQNDRNTWESTYRYYVPLNREDMDSLDHGTGTGQGFSIKGKESKQRTGSTLPVVDILGNIANQRERAVTRGEKNRVAIALYGLAKLNPNPDFWRVDKPPTIDVVQTVNGQKQVVTMIDQTFRSKDNVVMLKMRVPGGNVEERSVIFNERDERAMRMARAMKNLDGSQLGELLGTIAKATRYFASVNTQYNPVFGVTNLLRDVQTAMLNLSNTELAGMQARILMDATKILASASRTGFRNFGGRWKALAEEFGMEGGKTGYRDIFRTGQERAEKLQKALDPDWWMKTKWGKAITADGYLKAPFLLLVDHGARPVLNWLSDYNSVLENATRLAVYEKALKKGLSKAKAASLAKNMTVNFNRKGELGMQAGAMYAFFNASMQGMARMMETLASPAGKRIIAGGVLLGAVQALLLAASDLDDDDVPEFVKERNLVIPIGNKKYVTIVLPLGFNVLPNIGRHVAEAWMDGGRRMEKRISNIGGVVADAFNPLGGSNPLLQIASPTITDPLAALAQNKDWTGKPIYREDFNSLAPTPGFTRAKDTSSAPAKWVAEAINSLTGGTKYTPGIVSPTPDQLEYLLGQATGGVGREINKAATAVTSLMTGEELPAYKIPLAGRFYGDASGQANQGSKFYENLKELNQHEAMIKGLRKDGRYTDSLAYIREHPEARLVDQANRAERELSALRRKKRELTDQGKIGAVKLIEARITNEMRSFNDSVRQLEQQAP